MDSHERSRRFIKTIWRAQRQVGWGFTSLKSTGGDWDDNRVRVNAQRPFVVPALPTAQGDWYFTPCLFGAGPKCRRSNDHALPGRWLYADLDEVDPRTIDLKPTVAIESSPGRYQALWLLTRPLDPNTFSVLNQRLTYATGADKGGWHMSKVLRVPGTRNHKYARSPRVKLLWFERRAYAPREVVEYVKEHANTSPTPTTAIGMPDLPNTTAAHLRRRYKRKLGRRARKLLSVRTALGSEDRSARIWELENLCLDAGMSPEQTLIVVRSTAWNKYKGQRREVRMLWTEICKAVAARGEKVGAPSLSNDSEHDEQSDRSEPDEAPDEDDSAPLDIAPTRLARYLARDVRPPSWLVEHIWGRAAHGVWAGDYKTYKSTLLMDLAVSVASGRPFLGKFDVHRTGPVLYVQEENSHGFMHDRLHRIVQAKGLGNLVHTNGRRATPTIEFGHDLDLHLLNLSGFDLTRASHIHALESWCRNYQPALVILDPLYRLAPGVDENIQAEMAPILHPLADISNDADTALVLAHHYNKPNQGNASMRRGHRISGTSVFSRWWESSVYVERHGEPGEYSIKFSNEHREHGSDAPQVVTVEMSTEDPEAYAIHLAEFAEPDDSDDDEPDGLDLDGRDERIAVMSVRSRLGLANSRQAQQLLRRKGYDIRKAKGSNKLYAYPPSR